MNAEDHGRDGEELAELHATTQEMSLEVRDLRAAAELELLQETPEYETERGRASTRSSTAYGRRAGRCAKPVGGAARRRGRGVEGLQEHKTEPNN